MFQNNATSIKYFCIIKVAGHSPNHPSMPELKSTLSLKFQFKRTRKSVIDAVEMKTKNGLFYQLHNDFLLKGIGK